MSRLSTLAALLHLHADRAAANPHPIHLADSFANVFRAIGDELQAAHEEAGKVLAHIESLGAEGLKAIAAGFHIGASGALDAALAPAAAAAPATGDASLASQADQAGGLVVVDLEERAEQLHTAFRERAMALNINMPTWDTLDEGLRSCWVAAAGSI